MNITTALFPTVAFAVMLKRIVHVERLGFEGFTTLTNT
jgi:hypothetical protein